jgi:hypothetical protein
LLTVWFEKELLMLCRALPRVAGLFLVGLGLCLAPDLSWAQRAATPAPLPQPVAPITQPTHTPPPSPSPAVTTVKSDMPLCADLHEILPDHTGIKWLDCKSEVGLACVATITFYRAELICSAVFVEPLTAPTPLPAN